MFLQDLPVLGAGNESRDHDSDILIS